MTGSERARIEGQLGSVLYWKGDLATAAVHLRRSAGDLALAGDVVAEARYRGNLGAVLALLGDLADAEHELQLATDLSERNGLDLVTGAARANLGFVATLRGDLPGALDEFTRAETVYRRAQADSVLPRLHADHAQALADAGLFEDADALVQTGVAMYEQQGQTTELAGALLTSAEIKLAHGDAAGATAAADDAARRFAEQDRATWAVAARALALQARARSGSDDSASLSTDLVEVAATLQAQGWQRDATRCLLVATRLAVEAGRPSGIDSALRSAVEHGRTADRVLLDYVDAVEALNASDTTAARRSITHGLRVATSAQAEMGSIEMRAHAAVYGAELTVLGARIAVAAGRPRELLERIEASRVLSSRTPSIRPAQDEELAAALAELRGLDMTVADPATSDDQRAGAEERRQRLEAEIGRRARRTRGTGSDAAGIAAEVATVLTMLGDRQLLAHAALDGELLAVTVSEGRVRLHRLGTLERTRAQLDSITFALHRLNRLQGSDDARIAAAEMMFAAAAELAEHALPPDIAESDAPVVIVPTGVLHDVPWGLLAPLAGREVSVNPSLAAWARATKLRAERSTGPHAARPPGFIAGPDLDHAGTEVAVLSELYGESSVLTGDAATGEASLAMLGRCDLVHAACHGSFRRDNPMFSALHLADGPLNVYDLERVDRLPDVVVLSACSVAGATTLQGGSLLGLAAALITLGASNVVAPLTPISDASSVTVMQRLHRGLVAGATPAAALAGATIAHDLADPTAASFLCLGA